MIGFMKTEEMSKVGEVEGVGSVTVEGDAGLDWSPEMISPEAQKRRREKLERRLINVEEA